MPGVSVPDGLLILLRDEPKHGYQLATDFAERTAGVWTLNTGQVYTTLDRLVRDGYVEPDGTVDPDDARRRRWRLTEAGRDRTEAWTEEPPPEPGPRDELVLRVLLVAAVDPESALAVIHGQRQHLVTRLQDMRRGQRDAEDSTLARMAADAAAVRVESDLRWLDLCEARLAAQPAVQPPNPAAPRGRAR